MAFTGQLGTAHSQLGTFQLGVMDTSSGGGGTGFTGKLGTNLSRLANIQLGVVPSLSPPPSPPSADWTPFAFRENRPRIVAADALQVRPIAAIYVAIAAEVQRTTYPTLVPLTPDASKRTRSHEQIAAGILNSLLRQGEILKVSAEEFVVGFRAGDQGDWLPPAPTNISASLDRLARIFKQLNGGSGA